jgi:hypothetical protein
VVVFKTSPSKADAMRYIEAGLVFCTQETLPRLLETIELAQHGIFLPFIHVAKRAKYSFSVTPDHNDRARSAIDVAESDRKRFIRLAEKANSTITSKF